jgi:hypothetical protein
VFLNRKEQDVIGRVVSAIRTVVPWRAVGSGAPPAEGHGSHLLLRSVAVGLPAAWSGP